MEIYRDTGAATLQDRLTDITPHQNATRVGRKSLMMVARAAKRILLWQR
jgi:hypothetical protein